MYRVLRYFLGVIDERALPSQEPSRPAQKEISLSHPVNSRKSRSPHGWTHVVGIKTPSYVTFLSLISTFSLPDLGEMFSISKVLESIRSIYMINIYNIYILRLIFIVPLVIYICKGVGPYISNKDANCIKGISAVNSA